MKTLLLDKVYRPISFIGYRKMVKLIFTERADIISKWNGVSFYMGMEYPSIIVLKKYVRKKPLIPSFNFRGVFRRDLFKCQYTNVTLSKSQLTIDHIIPKSRGGKSTWENCVTASFEVNSAKGDRTPEEANLKLIREPKPPPDPLALEYAVLKNTHPEWKVYFPNIETDLI